LVILTAPVSGEGHAPATTSRLVLADLGIAASYLANSLDGGAESQGIAKASKAMLVAGTIVFLIPYVFLDVVPTGGNKIARLAVEAAFYTCLCVSFWVQRHCMFDTLRPPNAKWYSRRKSAEFSIPAPACAFWCGISIP